MNIAKCPKCEQVIGNIHYESHNPNSFSGFRGSQSFTAVAFPCGHAISAVPVTWEMRLEELYKINKELNQKLDYLYGVVSELTSLVRDLVKEREQI